MQVWNVLRAARWKRRTQKIAKKSRSGHHPTTLSGYIFATKAHIDSQKNLVKQQCLSQMSAQYGEHQLTSRWDLLASLGHPCKFQQFSRLGSVTAQHFSSGRQPNFAALNRGRHLYSAGRPSRWALAHILVLFKALWPTAVNRYSVNFPICVVFRSNGNRDTSVLWSFLWSAPKVS